MGLWRDAYDSCTILARPWSWFGVVVFRLVCKTRVAVREGVALWPLWRLRGLGRLCLAVFVAAAKRRSAVCCVLCEFRLRQGLGRLCLAVFVATAKCRSALCGGLCEFRLRQGLAARQSGRGCRAALRWLARETHLCRAEAFCWLGGSIYAPPAAGRQPVLVGWRVRRICAVPRPFAGWEAAFTLRGRVAAARVRFPEAQPVGYRRTVG